MSEEGWEVGVKRAMPDMKDAVRENVRSLMKKERIEEKGKGKESIDPATHRSDTNVWY